MPEFKMGDRVILRFYVERPIAEITDGPFKAGVKLYGSECGFSGVYYVVTTNGRGLLMGECELELLKLVEEWKPCPDTAGG